MGGADSAAATERNLPFMPDLTPADRQTCQRQAADALGREPHFSEPLAGGGRGPELAVIPPGVFEMGSPASEFGHCAEEAPQHYVVMREAFAIGRYPVTAEQFQQFQRATGWQPRPDLLWSRGTLPVMNLALPDMLAYIEWLNEETGASYRLPSEAEWEYAARAGAQSPFHFGDHADCDSMHFRPSHPDPAPRRRFRFPCRLSRGLPAPVGEKPPNLWGLFDVHGNVWEMTASHWTSSHFNARRDGRPGSMGDRRRRVTKGGSWFDPAVRARSAARMPRLCTELDTNLGFRLLRQL